MADLTGKRTMNMEKVRNLLMQAVTDLKDVLELRRVETRGDGHHVETITQLITTLGLKGSAAAEVLAVCQARNDVTYKGRMQVADEAMVTRTIQWAQRLVNETESWIKRNHPSVLGG